MLNTAALELDNVKRNVTVNGFLDSNRIAAGTEGQSQPLTIGGFARVLSPRAPDPASRSAGPLRLAQGTRSAVCSLLVLRAAG